jgi:hypothetical protein
VPTPVAGSNAAVNKVAERPAMPPSKCFSIVETPTGNAVAMAGSGVRLVGVNDLTLNVAVARMTEPY